MTHCDDLAVCAIDDLSTCGYSNGTVTSRAGLPLAVTVTLTECGSAEVTTALEPVLAAHADSASVVISSSHTNTARFCAGPVVAEYTSVLAGL